MTENRRISFILVKSGRTGADPRGGGEDPHALSQIPKNKFVLCI